MDHPTQVDEQLSPQHHHMYEVLTFEKEKKDYTGELISQLSILNK
jgi:hypothetical protein